MSPGWPASRIRRSRGYSTGTPSIRDVTKSRVLAAMDELQFRPSRAARMLSTQRSETIGVLAAAVGSHYGPASSVSAVEDAARSRGYYATVAHLASVAPGAISRRSRSC